MYRDSTRITRIGFFLRQTALDELPQLINILKGEMSFIGPRSYGIDKYSLSDGSFFHRLEVKPGLTGLAQVFAPKYAKNDTVFELDKRYIKTQCLLLDLYIICLSLWITVFGRWENATRKL
jgi:lipopolysaccharide/colanic/teichoic acid biosynthesis glycosyltransferase